MAGKDGNAKGSGRPDLERWQALAREELRGKDPDQLVWETPEGIRVKPLYTAADLEKLESVDTLPGMAPFLRGPRRQPLRGADAGGAGGEPRPDQRRPLRGGRALSAGDVGGSAMFHPFPSAE